MNGRTLRGAGALLLALATAACEADEARDPALDGAPAALPAEPATEPGVETAMPPAAPAETRGAAQLGAVLELDTLAGVGPYLTDGEGRALYLLEGEPAGQSTCYDACAEEWPPFLAPQGTPTPGAAPVREELLGTLRRDDGAIQVTYGGHALYYYHDDERPGQTRGQDLTDQWGEWYLVRPSGEPLEAHGGEGHS